MSNLINAETSYLQFRNDRQILLQGFFLNYWTTYRRLITISPSLKTNKLFGSDLNW